MRVSLHSDYDAALDIIVRTVPTTLYEFAAYPLANDIVTGISHTSLRVT